jgi:hypothetical protein
MQVRVCVTHRTRRSKSMVKDKETYRGLIFIRQGRIGSKSEGPDYYLQTKDDEYLLGRKTETSVFLPDYFLEYYCRKWVEIEGPLMKKGLIVETIHETCAGRMD